MTVLSSYSLWNAPCPWGSGWRHAALVDASPALFPAGFVVVAAAAALDGAPSLQFPAAASWPGALAGAEKSGAHISMDTGNCRIKEDFKNFCCFYFAAVKNSTFRLNIFFIILWTAEPWVLLSCFPFCCTVLCCPEVLIFLLHLHYITLCNFLSFPLSCWPPFNCSVQC